MAQELKLEVPEEVEVSVVNRIITVKGPKGELTREFPKEYISISKKDKEIEVKDNNTAKSRAIAGTFLKHIQNMIGGVQEEYVYKLKICFSHFPTTVDVSGNKVIIKNFLGGSKVVEVPIPKEVEVKVSNKDIEVKSICKEKAGSFSAILEQKTKAKKKDLRVFQDGIYLVSKAGKEV